MLLATFRSLAARKVRLLLTAFAIVLGVTFVTGTLVLTDTSTRLFDDQFAQATAGVDLIVRDDAAFGSAAGVEVDRDPVTTEDLSRIRGIDGVADAEGIVRGSALLVVDDEPIVPGGGSIGLSWAPEPYNPFHIRTGRPPAAATEVVIDQATAAQADVAVGEQLAVSLEDGSHRFDVVGIAGFGDAEGIPNATVALFAPDTAQQLYEMTDAWSEVQIVADAVTAETLRERLSDELGTGFEIATSQDTAAASAAAAQDQLLYLEVMLFVLAGTALLIGAFMIANTFAIVVAQRTREFATLRALGASSRQVLSSVLVEALVVASVASTVGVALGVGAANGLRGLAGMFGVVIPDGPLTVEVRTLAVGFAVGLGVTLVSSIVPARRAARTAPVAAMRELGAASQTVSRRRLVIGATLLGGGLAGLAAAAVSRNVALVGLGGVGTLLGTVVLAPAYAGRLAATIGRLAPGGLVVRLARTNVHRAARRTAATSTALALGLAVVTFMTVVASSAKAGITNGVDDVLRAELVVQSARGEMLGGLSPHVHERVSDVPGVQVASRTRMGHWQSQGSTRALTAIDPDTFPAVADLDMVEGDLAALQDGGIVLADNIATERGLEVGDELAMRFSRTGDQHLEVVGIADADDTAGVSMGYLISLDTFEQEFAEDVDADVFLKLATDADPDVVRADLEEVLTDFPTAAIYDEAGAKAAKTSMLDSMLGLVTVLLLLAVLIALLGITNALALSIVERTREVGMLRAVGTTRRQIRWLVGTEAALTAAVGALVGTGLGILLAAATVRALGTTEVLPLTVPVPQLAIYLVVAAIGGVLAGLVPGRRAARMDVLRATATG